MLNSCLGQAEAEVIVQIQSRKQVQKCRGGAGVMVQGFRCRSGGAGVEVQVQNCRCRGTAQRHRGTAQRHSTEVQERCRGAGEVQRCRCADVQMCRGAEVQRCSADEVQSDEVQMRCRGADEVHWWTGGQVDRWIGG